MGREIKRVPMDFNFPLGASYANAQYAAHREACEAEEHDECGGYDRQPPEGDGWQLWQTVSDGPISPVFADPDDLIEWMSRPVPEKDRRPYKPEEYPANPLAQGWRRDVAERFVRGVGRTPSMIVIDGVRPLSTAEAVDFLSSVDLPDDLHLCDACAAALDDDDFSATPYATSPLPADDDDVIPIP